MKKTFWLMAIILIWTGSAGAGVLKVKVPVNDFEQMQSRLEALEKENIQLQQEVKSLTKKPAENELGTQIDALEKENAKLKEEIKSLAEKSSEADAASINAMNSRLDSLGRENRQLKRSVASLKETGTDLVSDRRTAKQAYSGTNKQLNSHIFK